MFPLIWLVTFAFNSFAADGFLDYEASLSRVKFDGRFIAPNELHPQDLTEMLGRSSSGVYVAVGTERGFIGAALSNATHLFLFDIDARVVHYNRVTTMLLKATQNMEHYRYLKLNPQLLPLHAERLALSQDEIRRLQSIVRKPAWKMSVERIKHSTLWRPANVFGHFATANYIQEQRMFTKLKDMAEHGRIQSALGDLASREDMGRLSTAVGRAGLSISVLDISNVPDYVTADETVTALRLLEPAMRDDTLVVWTTLWDWTETYGWPYYWATIKELRQSALADGHNAIDWRIHFKPVICERLLRLEDF